jgi:hypothetical protein
MKKMVLALSMGLMTLAFSAVADEKEDIAAALKAAETWLQLTDGGKYAASYDATASKFRSVVAADQWQRAMEQVRGPLGAVKSRAVATGAMAPKRQSTPNGEVVVIQYETRFDKLPAAREMVAPMREPDGSWKVSGYFIKPSDSPQ